MPTGAAVTIGAVVLWLHVLAAVTWIGAAASFVLALTSVGSAGREQHEMVMRVAPRLNRVCLGCAALVLATGIANLAFVARHRGGILPTQFTVIIGFKLLLYILMCVMLSRAIRRAAPSSSSRCETDANGEPRRLVSPYAVMMAGGGIALALGLWLAGV